MPHCLLGLTHQKYSVRSLKQLFFVIDQVDSIVGGLLAVFIFVPVPLAAAAILLLLGAVTHYIFNFVLMHFGLRTRAA